MLIQLWKFELDQVKKASQGSNIPLQGCVLDKRNILQICHGVSQGKYLPPAIKYFEKQNYQLNTSQRPVMKKQEYAAYRLKGIGRELFKKGPRRIIKKILTKVGVVFVSDNN